MRSPRLVRVAAVLATLFGLLSADVAHSRLNAQDIAAPVYILIRSASDSASISEARISANGREFGLTDASGRLVVREPARPVTIRVVALGFRPRSVELGSSDSLVVFLSPVSVPLQDLVTTAPGGLVAGGVRSWTVPGGAIAAAPFAGEPDAFRVLSLVPAVRFSSLLSGRPMIRGLDADDAAFTIDGYEATNLYHLGRWFSAFPALAVGDLTVTTQPGTTDVGRTTGGRIAVRGATWEEGRRPEIQYGLGAWSGVTGWRGPNAGGVLAVRTLEGTLAGVADDGSDVNLGIADIYGRVDLGRASFTLFASRDEVVDRDPPDRVSEAPAALDWGNLILGGRVTLWQRGASSIATSVSLTRHDEQARSVDARRTIADVENLMRRVNATVSGTLAAKGGALIRFGAEVGSRRIRNIVAPSRPDVIPASTLDTTAAELAGYGAVELPLGQGQVTVGARVDHFLGQTLLQPRATLRQPVGSAWELTLGAGRASRAVHLITDSRTEPRVAFYDIWLPAGIDGHAPAKVDHLSLDLSRSSSRSSLRFGTYLASGSDQLELVPEYPIQPGIALIRSGRLRVVGAELEARTTSRDGRWWGQVSYTLERSQRDWGEGWLPWGNDRRHQLRAAGVFRPTIGTTLSATVEAGSGLPYTPIIAFDPQGSPVETFGPEYSRRGRGVFRMDLSILRDFRGPFGTLLGVGASVTNLSLGDQVVREGVLRPIPDGNGGSTLVPSSRTLFSLPPVPSVLLRVRF